MGEKGNQGEYRKRFGDGSRATLSISPDGKYLYFVSDAVGGYGGKDLFRARVVGSDFGPMENLGPDINTPGDEMFPYVPGFRNALFCFRWTSGNGWVGYFQSNLGQHGQVECREYEGADQLVRRDFGITFRQERKMAFLVPIAMMRVDMTICILSNCRVITIFIEGIVSDVDENPIEDATVRIVGRDGLNEKVLAKKDGKYRVELERDIRYVMMASARGYLNQNFELKTGPEEKNETYIVDFFLSPISKPVVIENIFYDFDKATLRPESKKALDEMIKMLNDNPNVTIELGAHTDRKGSEQYNERLAQRRAQSVVDYLIAGGIAQDRLEAKGYGESVPKAINKRMAKNYDFLNEGDVLTEEFIERMTPEQQEIADQINRRTEFKVLRTNYNLF